MDQRAADACKGIPAHHSVVWYIGVAVHNYYCRNFEVLSPLIAQVVWKAVTNAPGHWVDGPSKYSYGHERQEPPCLLVLEQPSASFLNTL